MNGKKAKKLRKLSEQFTERLKGGKMKTNYFAAFLNSTIELDSHCFRHIYQQAKKAFA